MQPVVYRIFSKDNIQLEKPPKAPYTLSTNHMSKHIYTQIYTYNLLSTIFSTNNKSSKNKQKHHSLCTLIY